MNLDFVAIFRGGIIIRDAFGNWVYSPAPLDLRLGTSDTTAWKIFDPQQYKLP